MINYIDNFFNLRLLRLDEVHLHEATEDNRLRNIYSRISKAKHLLNPVIVGKFNKDFILIDGANRTSSLQEIGCKLILAQVIDYKDPEIKLLTWDHLIYDFNIEKLKHFADENHLKYEVVKNSHALKMRSNNLSRISAADIQSGTTISIQLPDNFFNMIDTLSKLTSVYFHKYTFDRSESEIKFSHLQKYSRRQGVLIKFPILEKKHIIKIARSKHRLPAGISRHILVNRVLHVKYDINKLKSHSGIDKKQKELHEMLLNKIDNNKVRQYKESVIVFDE